jgi:hypothetical protein
MEGNGNRAPELPPDPPHDWPAECANSIALAAEAMGKGDNAQAANYLAAAQVEASMFAVEKLAQAAKACDAIAEILETKTIVVDNIGNPG